VSQNRPLPQPGDEILVYASVEEVTPEAWGPGTPPLLRIKIYTGDAGSDDTWASYWEPLPAPGQAD
jgi:hypothetical protein